MAYSCSKITTPSVLNLLREIHDSFLHENMKMDRKITTHMPRVTRVLCEDLIMSRVNSWGNLL